MTIDFLFSRKIKWTSWNYPGWVR